MEFSQLFRDYSHLRPALLEKMPKIQKSLPNGNDSSGIFDEHSNSIDLIEGDDLESSGLMSLSGGGGGGGSLKVGSDSVRFRVD